MSRLDQINHPPVPVAGVPANGGIVNGAPVPAPFPPAADVPANVIPQPFDPGRAQQEYWASQLWARLRSAVSFQQTQAAYKEWQKEPLLIRVLKSIYYGYQGLISLVEDIVRSVVKLGFLVLEGIGFVLDKLLGFFVRDCHVLQKTVKAIGCGVDDALGQQFHVIKHPLETVQAMWDGFNALCHYLKKTYDTAENGFLRQVFEDVQAQARAAWEYARANPYEVIRKISCLATHIAIAVLAVKYIGPAFNKGPDTTVGVVNATGAATPPVVPQAAAPVIPKATFVPRIPIVPVIPQAAASAAVTPVIPGAVAVTPVAMSTAAPRAQQRTQLIEQIKQLIAMIDIFDLTDPDDNSAITALRADIIDLQVKLYAVDSSAINYYVGYLNERLRSLDETRSVLDEEDDDDKEAFEELSLACAAVRTEIAFARDQTMPVSMLQRSSVNDAAFVSAANNTRAFFNSNSNASPQSDTVLAARRPGVSSVPQAA